MSLALSVYLPLCLFVFVSVSLCLSLSCLCLSLSVCRCLFLTLSVSLCLYTLSSLALADLCAGLLFTLSRVPLLSVKQRALAVRRQLVNVADLKNEMRRAFLLFPLLSLSQLSEISCLFAPSSSSYQVDARICFPTNTALVCLQTEPKCGFSHKRVRRYLHRSQDHQEARSDRMVRQ